MEATPSAHVFSTTSSHILYRRTSSHILHRRNPSTSTLRRHDYINDLHCIKPEINDPNINVKLYDYIKIFVEFYIVNINIAKVYIHVVFRCRRQKPTADVIFDHRRAYDKNPPPPQIRCRRRLRQNPPPLQNRCRRL
jgi:hypothetical protein